MAGLNMGRVPPVGSLASKVRFRGEAEVGREA